ncbi:MAG: hypothetical protein VR72_01470 [Clostridiaceae bacterium BRH_c20a]|nr:MAG: hypothetical protein VR72_01470 [Clostridiaceae bacterium BRH_c20a]
MLKISFESRLPNFNTNKELIIKEGILIADILIEMNFNLDVSDDVLIVFNKKAINIDYRINESGHIILLPYIFGG